MHIYRNHHPLKGASWANGFGKIIKVPPILHDVNVQKEIFNSRDVMRLLGICENTLLDMERDGRLKIDFRIGNRKRYYLKNIEKSISLLKK